MSEEEIIKKLDDIWNNCEEIDNHNPETERTGYKMYDDYIFVRNGIKRLNKALKNIQTILIKKQKAKGLFNQLLNVQEERCLDIVNKALGSDKE